MTNRIEEIDQIMIDAIKKARKTIWWFSMALSFSASPANRMMALSKSANILSNTLRRFDMRREHGAE